MIVLRRNDNGITCRHSLLNSIEHEDAFAFYESPYLRTMVMDLVGNILPWVECDTLGKRMLSAFVGRVIEYTIGSPTTFLIHKTRSEVLDSLLDLLGVFLAAYKNTIRTCCYNYVFQAIYIDRML